MFSRQESYTQALLKKFKGAGDKTDYVTYWIPSGFADPKKHLIIKGIEYKIVELYATYKKEHVEAYPKVFKTAIPEIGT